MPPLLILLNGPPGCGKSTLAQMYADEHPFALNLDIDRVRALIGQWQRDRHTAGLLARRIALAMARTHLVAGHDVVIPQFLGRLDFIEQVERLARDVAAGFHEVVLLDTRENAIRRFTERARLGADHVDPEAQALLDRGGGLTELAEMYDRLLSVVAARPATRVVRTESGEPERAYRLLLDQLGEHIRD